MALKANYSGSIKLDNAYLKVKRIWGSKEEGWNGLVAVYEKDTDIEHKAIFQINATYLDGENPFDIIYGELGKLSFLSNVQHDITTKFNSVTIDDLITAAGLIGVPDNSDVSEVEPPKKKRQKKKV